jgi:hypothetical protein
VEGKRGSECLLKSVSNIDFNPDTHQKKRIIESVMIKTFFTNVIEGRS